MVYRMSTQTVTLLKAVCLGRLRLTRLLLEGGAYINESNEHGETPLMIACKSRYSDPQGVPKAKMVGYLLESGADPNIQDKSGKTALMHACLGQAGPEVVSLLLDNGADPCVVDHVGCSALIHAINSNDEETLNFLMDAFKANGKEVIIITTDKLGCGNQMTKQFLKIPSPTELDQWEKFHNSISCACPSEIQLSTLPQETPLSSLSGHIFSFHNLHTTPNSQTTHPSHKPHLLNKRLNKVNPLQRLHSEPWLKIPQSLQSQDDKGSPHMEDLPGIRPEEVLAFEHPCSYQVSTDLKEATSLSQATHQKRNTSNKKLEGTLSHKMSFDGLSSLYSLSHSDLQCKSIELSTSEKFLPNLAVSSLIDIIQRRKLGMAHYSSDSQLLVSGNYPTEGKKLHENRPLLTTQSSTLISSKDHTKNPLQENLQKKQPTKFIQRRGSGAPLSCSPRPGFLPPINHKASISHIAEASSSNAISSSNKPICGLETGIRQYLPSAPAGLPKDSKTRRMLMRRHSMQSEQINRLGDFKEILG